MRSASGDKKKQGCWAANKRHSVKAARPYSEVGGGSVHDDDDDNNDDHTNDDNRGETHIDRSAFSRAA